MSASVLLHFERVFFRFRVRAVASTSSTFLRFYPYQLQEYMYVQHLYIKISYVSTTFEMLRISSSTAQ